MSSVKVYLKKYRESLYMLFFIPQFLCVSLGWGSADLPYKIVFAVGSLFLILSMLGEEYSFNDIIKMVIFGGLVVWAFSQNRNRSLILACMTIFGAKNIKVKKILKYTFWILTLSIFVKVLACAVGILPNEALTLPKENGKQYIIYSYGYNTPNGLYFHLVIAVLLGMVTYGKKVRWLYIGSFVLLMYLAYRILFSRTGWICFLFAVLLYLVNNYIEIYPQKLWGRWIRRFMIWSAVLLCLLNWILVYLWNGGYSWVNVINSILNNRIMLASGAFRKIGLTLFGSRGAIQLDMLYATMLLNYGIVLTVICICMYTRLLQSMHRKKEGLMMVALTVIALYSFMEVNAINPMWNPFLLLLAEEVFGERQKETMLITDM